MGMLKQKFTVDPLSMEGEELNENFAENYYYGEDEDSFGLEEDQLDLKEEG